MLVVSRLAKIVLSSLYCVRDGSDALLRGKRWKHRLCDPIPGLNIVFQIGLVIALTAGVQYTYADNHTSLD
jgi:hypothetical protein